MDFEEFQVVILHQPANMPEYEPERLKESQEGHRAYLTSLREAGTIVSNGAVLGHEDPSIRGLVIYAGSSLDEVKEIAAKDPAVIDGRLVPEVFSWRIPTGTMRVSGIPVDSRGA